MQLRPAQARVLGSLVEKELSTPDQYPLTLKSLTGACNQVSNRDPIVAYAESTVMATLDELKQSRLIRFVLPSHGRTAVRYRHVLDEALGLDRRQCALLAALLLRGPQTVGELRARTDRMAQFDSLDEVAHELHLLAAATEPLAASLGRQPGQKEERWISPLLASPFEAFPLEQSPSSLSTDPSPATGIPHNVGPGVPTNADAGTDRVHELRADVDALRAEVGALRRDLEALRSSLGG